MFSIRTNRLRERERERKKEKEKESTSSVKNNLFCSESYKEISITILLEVESGSQKVEPNKS